MSEWTKAEDAKLTEMAALGCSAGMIATAMIPPEYEFRSRNSIVGRARRIGVQLLGKLKTPTERRATVWEVPEVLETHRAMWAAGVPVRLMAARMTEQFGVKITASAVIGKAHRSGLAKEFPRSNSCDGESSAQSNKLRSRAKAAKRALTATEKPYKPQPILADVSYARPWLTRETGECAFPLGERGAVMSCCFPTGETYCEAHRQAMGGTRKAWTDKHHVPLDKAA